jgi:predicted small lipoprotein YifL
MAKNFLQVFIALILLSLTACTHIGPRTVPRDRFDYNTAIAKSWKEQTLLNIVKLRYADMPLFVEVASVVSGYALESSVNLGGLYNEGSLPGDIFSFGTNGKFTDRPTITYVPITGQKFNKSFMTPIPPGAHLVPSVVSCVICRNAHPCLSLNHTGGRNGDMTFET